MKNTIVNSLLFCILAGLGSLSAQEMEVSKTAAPPEAVRNEFAKGYSDAENPVWYVYQNEKGHDIYFATFMRDGDQKRVYYKNERHANLVTVVPVEYCPRKIKNLTAALHPDYQIKEVAYMQSIYGPFYCAILTKGKKKKVEYLTLFFSPSGELPSDANDATFEMLHEISIVPPTK